MKIINYTKSLATLLVAGVAFTACSNESDEILDEQTNNPTGVKTYFMTVNAIKGDDASTRALSLDGSTLNVTWAANEPVLVYQDDTMLGTLYSEASNNASTTLTGTLTNPDVEKAMTFHFRNIAPPCYYSQLGTLEDIAANYDYCLPATVASGGFNITGNSITVPGGISFGANQQAIVKFTLTYNDAPSTPYKTSQLIVVADGNTYTITPEQSTNILYFAIPGINKKSIRLYSNGRTYTKTDVSFENGQYYAITVKMKSPSTPSGVEAIDLGLPSGTLWANMNIGASTPEEYGDYFSWGEVVPKSNYDYSTYIYCNGSYDTMTKYCTDPSIGNVDNLTSLDSFDDAAYMNWGNNWRMPTKDQIQELIDYTNNEWVSDYNDTGINGFKFSNITDASIYIFIPAAGMRHESGLYFNGACGRYWSSSVYEYGSSNAYFIDVEESIGAHLYSNNTRISGFPVRPVYSN